jgi:hypothetical protein
VLVSLTFGLVIMAIVQVRSLLAIGKQGHIWNIDVSRKQLICHSCHLEQTKKTYAEVVRL